MIGGFTPVYTWPAAPLSTPRLSFVREPRHNARTASAHESDQVHAVVWIAGTEDVASSFPPSFVAFLRANDIHPDNYAISDVPRFVRVSPRAPPTLDRVELERQLGVRAEPVAWLPGYYRLPSHVKIAGCEAYSTGHLYGIDVSSGAAVAALDARPGDHVLDLCCAPGAKLCALADVMGLSGTLTGVDVNEERLRACRTLCTKYGVSNVRELEPIPITCAVRARPGSCGGVVY